MSTLKVAELLREAAARLPGEDARHEAEQLLIHVLGVERAWLFSHATDEVDAEAVLEARGHACRPGPRAQYSALVLGAIDNALKGPFTMQIDYAGAQDAAPRSRSVEPYGVLFGMRGYLIAREMDNGGKYRHFRLDRIDGLPDPATLARYQGPTLVLPLGGELTIGDEAALPGSCVLVGGLAEIAASDGVHWLATQPCA